jgi:hypothetical protein
MITSPIDAAPSIDIIQYFLCKLGMKPNMHLVEIIIFSLYHVIDRPAKIIKDLLKDRKSQFSELKIGGIFLILFL